MSLIQRCRVGTSELAAYYELGFSMRECGKKFRLSLERVRQILRAERPDIIRVAHRGSGLDPKNRLLKQVKQSA